jgi:hypothetical protein
MFTGVEAMARLVVGFFLLAISANAAAYVGPGMGLGAVAAILGLLLAFFLAVAGVVWYPVKRLFRGKRGAIASAGGPDAEARNGEPERDANERSPEA